MYVLNAIAIGYVRKNGLVLSSSLIFLNILVYVQLRFNDLNSFKVLKTNYAPMKSQMILI